MKKRFGNKTLIATETLFMGLTSKGIMIKFCAGVYCKRPWTLDPAFHKYLFSETTSNMRLCPMHSFHASIPPVIASKCSSVCTFCLSTQFPPPHFEAVKRVEGLGGTTRFSYYILVHLEQVKISQNHGCQPNFFSDHLFRTLFCQNKQK